MRPSSRSRQLLLRTRALASACHRIRREGNVSRVSASAARSSSSVSTAWPMGAGRAQRRRLGQTRQTHPHPRPACQPAGSAEAVQAPVAPQAPAASHAALQAARRCASQRPGATRQGRS
eukprot:scaffold4747_cov52-Phaeocystis_antarctica.AAC.6